MLLKAIFLGECRVSMLQCQKAHTWTLHIWQEVFADIDFYDHKG